MALTILMHMKQSGTKYPGRHLKNAIRYILKPEKNEQGLWIGGNAGSTAEEIYRNFIRTKAAFGKTHGRQGYHFVISFREQATARDAERVMAAFTKEYLGDHYDYVYAIHLDTAHTHAHVIFNSVSRTTGLKYHYKKGDWEKSIQPVTDRICQRFGFEKFTFEEKGHMHYPEWLRTQEGRRTWRSIVRADMDALADTASDLDDFMQKLIRLGYEVRKGKSKKHGAYFAIKPQEAKKAVRSYQLGKDYTILGIHKRIGGRLEHMQEKRYSSVPVPKKLRWYRQDRIQPQRPQICLPPYQFYYVRRYLKHSVLYQYQNTRNYRDTQKTGELSAACRYLIRNRITRKEQLLARETDLKREAAKLTAARRAIYRDDFYQEARTVCKRDAQLQSQIALETDEEKSETLQDALDQLYHTYPVSELRDRETRYQAQLADITARLRSIRKDSTAIAVIKNRPYVKKEEKRIRGKLQL